MIRKKERVSWRECGITLLNGFAVMSIAAALGAPFVWLVLCAVGLAPMTWSGLLTTGLVLLGIGCAWLVFAAVSMVRDRYRTEPETVCHASPMSTIVVKINPLRRPDRSSGSSSSLPIASRPDFSSTMFDRGPAPKRW